MKSLGFRDFVRFLRAKGKKDGGDVCSTCGVSEWHVQLPDDSETVPTEQTLAIGFYSRSDASPDEWSPLVSGAVPVVAIICSNCGMTRIFASRVVSNWIKENPEDGE